MKRWLLVLFFLSAVAFGCENDVPEADPAEGPVTLFNREYSLDQGRYYSGYYDFVKRDCVVLHIRLTNPAGITVEIDKELLDRWIAIEPNPNFWFIGLGDGKGNWQALEHSDVDFDGYTGWFRVNLDESTGQCALEFDLTRGAVKSQGKIEAVFERMESL